MIRAFSRIRKGAWLTVAAIAVAGCASTPAPPAAGTSSIINPARSDRGNPPFYEVLGERYYVLDSSDGYRERGVASWYGREFHGRPTSGGEIYDMNALTAAHKTLPIPTWVEVTNLTNGRQVIVKVNDRGPFVDNRLIDLSQRAAAELDMIETGTARVQVRALGAPATPPPAPLVSRTPPEPSRGGLSIISAANAATVSPSSARSSSMYIQVGAFSDRQNANGLAERLKENGFDNTFVLTSGQGADRIHRVRLGPIAGAGEFDRLRAGLRAIGVADARLVEVDR